MKGKFHMSCVINAIFHGSEAYPVTYYNVKHVLKRRIFNVTLQQVKENTETKLGLRSSIRQIVLV